MCFVRLGGRPSVKINEWEGADPGAPTLIDSRGVTRGAYRGFGELYSWEVPASELKTGQNTLVIGVIGKGDADFLSANYIIDAVELQGKGGPKNDTSSYTSRYRRRFQ
ncbi:rhamnogalacturonase B [Colletotrichum melonis]|uniref:Rhamnogalacturonase B n=1 Tax=Colletotrichum melonis TaxID=1209925 RepID=A0AAI9U2I7_9PEZI|nr:rhamnogalacturonase B [Colletotrichum melonis]